MVVAIVGITHLPMDIQPVIVVVTDAVTEVTTATRISGAIITVVITVTTMETVDTTAGTVDTIVEVSESKLKTSVYTSAKECAPLGLSQWSVFTVKKLISRD